MISKKTKKLTAFLAVFVLCVSSFGNIVTFAAESIIYAMESSDMSPTEAVDLETEIANEFQEAKNLDAKFENEVATDAKEVTDTEIPQESIEVTSEDGLGYTVDNGVWTFNAEAVGRAYTFSEKKNTKGDVEIVSPSQIIIDGGGKVVIDFFGDRVIKSPKPITVINNSHLTLRLAPGSNTEITATDGAGIGVESGSKFTLDELEFPFPVDLPMGKLKATGSTNNAGIGGYVDHGCGQIEINYGQISANGGNYAAGIGGNKSFTDVIVTINGGEIVSRGGYSGAGIGGGYNNTIVSITINGGEISAYSEDNGAGIGGGYNNTIANITINAGKILAYAGARLGAGIGGGHLSHRVTVTINGGTISATGGIQGAGIGSGYKANTDPVFVNILGGEIVEAKGGNLGAGIGAGDVNSASDITIQMANCFIRNAIGGDYGAGIGGADGVGGNANIYVNILPGAKIENAIGGKSAAGIGAGNEYTTSGKLNIEISGGYIKNATGGENGAGIGSGQKGHLNTTINITGGQIDNAIGSLRGAGIGLGDDQRPNVTADINIGGGGKILNAQGGSNVNSAGIGKFLDSLSRVTVQIKKTDFTTIPEIFAVGGIISNTYTNDQVAVANLNISNNADFKNAGSKKFVVSALETSEVLREFTLNENVENVAYTIEKAIDTVTNVQVKSLDSNVSGHLVVPVANEWSIDINTPKNFPRQSVSMVQTNLDLAKENPSMSTPWYTFDQSGITFLKTIQKISYDISQTNADEPVARKIAIGDGLEVKLNLDSIYIEDVTTPISVGKKSTLLLNLNDDSNSFLVAKPVLTFSESGAGIAVGSNARLVIDGNGKLNAYGGYGCAGIGGVYDQEEVGDIEINGGDITAYSGEYAAAIGGGHVKLEYENMKVNVAITGGKVNAFPGEGVSGSAGIGSGYVSNANSKITVNIDITGGVIKSLGSSLGAGVGLGRIRGLATLNVAISGSDTEVTANGGSNASGIGLSNGSTDIDATIKILNGKITAYGKNDWPGIGVSETFSENNVGHITLEIGQKVSEENPDNEVPNIVAFSPAGPGIFSPRYIYGVKPVALTNMFILKNADWEQNVDKYLTITKAGTSEMLREDVFLPKGYFGVAYTVNISPEEKVVPTDVSVKISNNVTGKLLNNSTEENLVASRNTHKPVEALFKKVW